MALIDLHKLNKSHGEKPVKDIDKPVVFDERLEYSCPARGTWTIAHSTMLVPGSHQIFVGASACLRGVVLSAAEYDGLDRFSMLMIDEQNIIGGNMEDLFIDGITDIIEQLPYTPNIIWIFSSCIHHFLSTDFNYINRKLSENFPCIDFVNCSMHPTMRKNRPNAEEHLRTQLYTPLTGRRNSPVYNNSVNIIGNNEPIKTSSDYMKMLMSSGIKVNDLASCTDYDEYLAMRNSCLNIYSLPNAKYCCEQLKKKLNQDFIYLPLTWNMKKIKESLKNLCIYLNLNLPDFNAWETAAKNSLKKAIDVIGDNPLYIDYSAITCYLELAKLLLETGFNVQVIYGDIIQPDDKDALEWLKANTPELPFRATKDFHSRFVSGDEAELAKLSGKKIIAIGQKAAYFTGATNFVNMIENNGTYGFSAIETLSDMLIDAYFNEKDVPNIIQVKAWGCSA